MKLSTCDCRKTRNERCGDMVLMSRSHKHVWIINILCAHVIDRVRVNINVIANVNRLVIENACRARACYVNKDKKLR